MNIRTILLYSLLSFLVFMPDVHAQEPVDYVMFDKIRQEGLNRSPIGHEIPSKIGEPMRQTGAIPPDRPLGWECRAYA